MNKILRNHLIASLLAVAGATNAADVPAIDQPAETPVYTIKESVIGSNIPRIVVSSALPFDKTYGQLTLEQRNIIRQDYESLGLGDDPPFPQHGLRELVTPIYRVAVKAGASGVLKAAVEVDSQGVGRSVSILKSPGPDVSRMTELALMQENFKPATCKGQPCVMKYIFYINLVPH